VNAEFNWWLLIVGLVLGAALTWLVLAESTRRDADLTDTEQRGEALWIASVLTSSGRPTDGPQVEEILQLHRDYLAAPPPDDPAANVDDVPIEPAEPAEPTIDATTERANERADKPEGPGDMAASELRGDPPNE
jgi:hypothetical protein